VKLTKEVELRGNRFLGIVKTCSRGYPKAQFKIWGNQVHERGDHKVYETMIDGKRVYALGWYAKPNLVKTFIASTYSTLPGEPIRVLRTKPTEEDGEIVYQKRVKVTKRPVVIQKLFEYFGTIDFHDRYRQGYLKLEKTFVVKSWTKRIFTTLLGMCVVDAFRAYLYTTPADRRDDDFFQFVDKLAYSLINNALDDVVQTRRTLAARVEAPRRHVSIEN
jgi:hypothetical protein